MIKCRVIRRYDTIYGSWKSIIPAIEGDVMTLFACVALNTA